MIRVKKSGRVNNGWTSIVWATGVHNELRQMHDRWSSITAGQHLDNENSSLIRRRVVETPSCDVSVVLTRGYTYPEATKNKSGGIG